MTGALILLHNKFTFTFAEKPTSGNLKPWHIKIKIC